MQCLTYKRDLIRIPVTVTRQLRLQPTIAQVPADQLTGDPVMNDVRSSEILQSKRPESDPKSSVQLLETCSHSPAMCIEILWT